MAVWKIFWVDVDYWTALQVSSGRDSAALLGESVQKALQDQLPSPAEGVGVLSVPAVHGNEPEVHCPLRLESHPPRVLLWSRGDLSDVHVDGFSAADLADAGPSGSGERPALLLSAQASEVLDATAPELGACVYRLIAEPGILDVSVGNLQVRSGPLVSLDEECWVVWLHSLLRDPSTLSPSEMADLGWRPTDGAASAPDAALSLAGFLLQGGRFEETFVPAGPGQLSVFFGRNGAGKSLALSTVDQALCALREGGIEQTGDRVRPWCTVLLEVPAQERAPGLFARVLAHLGWGPDTTLSWPITSYCKRKIPAWDLATERPLDASGLTAAQLAELPLPQLREAIADAITASMPWCPSARVLADLVTSSPVLTVSPDWRVGLAVLPRDAGPDAKAAAAEYLRVLRAPGADSALVDDDFQQPLLRWARQLAGELPAAPVVLATANLAHAGPWSGPNEPGSGWQGIGQAVADGILRSLPRPVPFAPGRTTLQPGDAAAEEAVLGLLEHLAEPAKDTLPGDVRHPFARHHPLAAKLAALIEAEANGLIPQFVADTGAIKVSIADPGEWHVRRAMALFTGGAGDADVPIDVLPSGLRTWVLAAVSFAAARLAQASWTGKDADLGWTFSWKPGDVRAVYDSGRSDTAARKAFHRADPESLTPAVPATPRIIYLLDEPEAHLHLAAQRDVVTTATMLAERSCGVLAATHSLSFLDTPPAAAQVLTFDASQATIQSSSWTGLQDLTRHASALGITPSALAMACRGVLVVEGPHDREIIQRYADIDLDKERIIIVPLHGAHGAAGIAEMEFLHALRIPVHVLLDHVRGNVIRAASHGHRQHHLNQEERKLLELDRELKRLHSAVNDLRMQVNVLPFPHIDIIRAVPEDEINWALRQAGKRPFTGWKDFDTRADAEFRNNGQKFKETFRQVTGVEAGQVIRRLITGDRRGPRSPDLHGILAAMIAYTPAGNTAPGITVAPPSA